MTQRQFIELYQTDESFRGCLIDAINYGNPTNDQFARLQEVTYLQPVVDDCLKNLLPPTNTSPATVAELNKIIELSDVLNINPEHKHRYQMHDTDLISSFRLLINKDDNKGIEINKLIDTIIDDCINVILKLKYAYQRPRPYQLGFYLNLPVYVHESISCNSPSYPSNHAFLGKIISEVVGWHFPLYLESFRTLSYDFNYSRIFMGVHYNSDIDAGVLVAGKVLMNREFKKKFKL